MILKNLRGVGKAAIYKKYWSLLIEKAEYEVFLDGLYKSSMIEKDNIDQAYNKALKEYKIIKQMKDVSVITVFDKEYPKKLISGHYTFT